MKNWSVFHLHRRWLLTLGVLAVILLPFTNCGGKFQPAQYNQNSLCSEGVCSNDTAGKQLSLEVKSDEIWMKCSQNLVQIGGKCNPGDYADNYISTSISRGGTPIRWNNNISVYTDARCENGLYFINFRRPDDPSAPQGAGLNGYVEYQLSLQINSRNSASDVNVQPGPKVTYTVKVQWPECP